MRLSELAESLGMRLKGADAEFTGLNTLGAASPTEVSFLANPKYAHMLCGTKALAVIVDELHADQVERALISANPYYAFSRAALLFTHNHSNFRGISELAYIHPSAQLGEGCNIHPFAYISEGAVLGAGCTIFPHTYIGMKVSLGDKCTMFPGSVLMAGVTVGSGCVLQPGAIVGTDGFGFVRVEGQMQKVPQIGSVVLHDGVEIGANSCVDRATLTNTTVGKDSKLDNLVQIGHNVGLGEQCLVIAQVGIAGSTVLGNRVTVAGQAGFAGHLNVGDDVTIGPQAGVAKDIPAGVTGSGTPFMDYSVYLRSATLQSKLPDMHKKLQALSKELELLKEQMAELAREEKND